MAKITINNRPLSECQNMVFFTDVPNIVTYDNSNQGTPAKLYINVGTSQYSAQPNGQTITINGETITSVSDISQCHGRFFYLGTNPSWVAPTIVDALKNCPSLFANYDIMMNSSDAGDIEEPYSVLVVAKDNGTRYNMSLSYTIDDTHTLAFYNYDGQSNDDLKDDKFATIQLQMYKYTDFDRYKNVDTYGDVLNDESYVTTMSKTYYSDSVSFDISPLISTFTEYGKLVYFRFILTLMTSSPNHPYQQLASVHNLYALVGYRANGSIPYVPEINTPMLLQNVGNGITYANLHSLYLYKPYILFSWLASEAQSTFRVRYLNSAYEQQHHTSVVTYNLSNESIDKRIDLNPNYMRMSTYIELTLPSNRGKLLYTIAKGLDAADECTRVEWRNEYGGISFFDFSGKHTKSISLGMDTYEKSDLDYYKEKEREQTIIYSRDSTIEYTLTSHLVDKMGTQFAESLAKSKRVWITNEETNIREEILVNNISIDEAQGDDKLYQVTIKYTYSRTN